MHTDLLYLRDAYLTEFDAQWSMFVTVPSRSTAPRSTRPVAASRTTPGRSAVSPSSTSARRATSCGTRSKAGRSRRSATGCTASSTGSAGTS